jgi:hypothetical protein
MKTPFKKNQPPGAFGGLDIPLIQPRVATATFSAMAGAPHELVKTYHDELEKHINMGRDEADAHKRALRLTTKKGWIKTGAGWKKAMPDISDKVNDCEAIKQPDGSYFIEGVPCFYPNAVKGKHLAFSAGDIKQIIKNTNECNARPTIIEGHPNEMQAAMGQQQDAHGFAVNFREHPKNAGHVLCDFVGVEPEYVKRLQEKKLPHLSVGFAKDGGGLNRRFGHVALLGGTSPALSHLPATDFFQASGNTVYFSADTETFFPKGKNMLSKKQKECFAAMSSANEAYEAAEKGKELGQPDADARCGEAYAAFKSAKMNFDASMGEESPAAAPGDAPMMPDAGDPATSTAAGSETTGAYDANVPPSVTPMGSQTPAFATIEDLKTHFTSEPDVAFNAMVDNYTALSSKFDKAIEVIEALRIKDRANVNRNRFQHFHAEAVKLRRLGHPVPQDAMLKKQWESFFNSKDYDQAESFALEMYAAMPAQQTPATALGRERFFDASDSESVRTNGKPAAKLTAADIAIRGRRSSPDDEMWAALSEAI